MHAKKTKSFVSASTSKLRAKITRGFVSDSTSKETEIFISANLKPKINYENEFNIEVISM